MKTIQTRVKTTSLFVSPTKYHVTSAVLVIVCVIASLPTPAHTIYCAFARNSADSLYFVPYFLSHDSIHDMAPVNFTGKWSLDRSEKFEEFLKKLDMGYLARKIALAITPVHTIEQTDESFVLKITTPRGTQVAEFEIGKEFEQNTLAYQGKFKCTATWEGSTLVTTFAPLDAKKNSIPVRETREIIDDEYILTIYFGDVVCKRIFKKTK